MAFNELTRFPENVSLNFTGGPEYMTEVIEVNSGDESRNQVWSQARHRYEVSRAPSLPAQWQPLRAFFHAVGGRKDGFRLKDWLDYQCPDAAGTGVIGLGHGTGYPTLQMGKKYLYGTVSRIRDIQKPITTVAPSIYKNGTLLIEGHGAGQETPDLSTGIVTFYASSSATITGITKANPAVVTTSSPHGFANGMTVYISGAGGMTELNTIAFAISSVSSTAFTLTGIDSRAYGTYTSGGTAAIFPQPSDTLTWIGEFDVPCRFDTDSLKGEVVEKNPSKGLIVAWNSIPIVEVRFP